MCHAATKAAPRIARAIRATYSETLIDRLDPRLLGELQRRGQVFPEKFVELIHAHQLRLDAELSQIFLYRRRLQSLLRRAVQPIDDVARRFCRRRQSDPEGA